ncbi:MAG: hypothetical protein U0412_07175 [Nitrospira sp.]
MAEHDLEKLLGAFAADTLTPEERQQLYTAALQDQRLFDALADEQALKELLTDPSVRRRLLDALERPAPAKNGSAGSWIDWFRRPANLALVGGLATAVFAVILGTKVYQDSLTRSAQSVASETAKPAAPSSSMSTPAPTPPQESIGQAVPESTPQTEKKKSISAGTSTGTPTTQSRVQQTSDAAPERARAQPVPAPVLEEKRAEIQSIVPDKAVQDRAASTDRPVAVRPAPPTALSESTSMPAAPPVPAIGATASAIGARALFYGGSDRSGAGPLTQESEPLSKSSSEADGQSSLFKRKLEGLSSLRAKAAPTTPKPLALRYEIVAMTAAGQEQPLNPTTAAGSSAALQLIVEANQESYLQIWRGVGSTDPRLLAPQQESGQISMKLQPGQRPHIPLPVEKGLFLIRLARVPFGPITRQEAALLDRPATGQLQESGMGAERTDAVTYVATTDLSASLQALVDLTPHR